jgi:hypothetical protein
MSFYSPSDSKFTRLYHEEVEIAFSAIDCVLNREKSVYGSAELTTGLRLYEALREHKVKTRDELKQKMGAAWFTSNIWNPNVKSARDFTESVRHTLDDGTTVITPAPFTAPGWSQPEYLAFWETLLRTRTKSVWFSLNWQYSNGCTFEFAVAEDAGLPTFDHEGRPLGRSKGIELMRAAIQSLDEDGFNTSTLAENLKRVQTIDVRTREAFPV